MKIERGGGMIASSQRIVAQSNEAKRGALQEDNTGRKPSALGIYNRVNVDPMVVSEGEHNLFERSEGIIEDYFNF